MRGRADCLAKRTDISNHLSPTGTALPLMLIIITIPAHPARTHRRRLLGLLPSCFSPTSARLPLRAPGTSSRAHSLFQIPPKGNLDSDRLCLGKGPAYITFLLGRLPQSATNTNRSKERYKFYLSFRAVPSDLLRRCVRTGSHARSKACYLMVACKIEFFFFFLVCRHRGYIYPLFLATCSALQFVDSSHSSNPPTAHVRFFGLSPDHRRHVFPFLYPVARPRWHRPS